MPELGKIGGDPGENVTKVEALIQESGIDIEKIKNLLTTKKEDGNKK